MLGHPTPIASENWPAIDDRYLSEDSVEIVVQINGKLRDRLKMPAAATPDEIQAAARALPKIAEALAGSRLIKAIAVPGRLVNFVIAPK